MDTFTAEEIEALEKLTASSPVSSPKLAQITLGAGSNDHQKVDIHKLEETADVVAAAATADGSENLSTSPNNLV